MHACFYFVHSFGLACLLSGLALEEEETGSTGKATYRYL